ncbi:hypothetical protein CEUSTIGMA_g13915.t1 [Chlamydomonas eustigma]|uniref:Retinoblastoma-associated protein N-terminal domain-containing protein n=1 Tax=Chlamydomonas eustigma TaxID=1157962 RepID=A0A250XTZ3_9CHLO|nr:hypothetical protein CEUSTIGMA_g13915.t1 [Chlamydomonas eustigma]|eukprot:GAX86508.1 hypothetical protein CEUSTIGMA_g13915.t1 [Chlamydomonas eustigma]
MTDIVTEPTMLFELALKTPDDDWLLIQQPYEAAKKFIDECDRKTLDAQHICDVDEDARKACLLFIAKALASRGRPPGSLKSWTISKIISSSSTNAYDFFRELPVTASLLAPFLKAEGSAWPSLESQCHAKEWQRVLINLTLLSKKFKEFTPKFIPDMGVRKPAVLRFGWLLFLNLKSKLIPAFPDLVSCINLLACVINVLVAHAPEGFLAMCQGSPSNPVSAISTTLKTDPGTVNDLMASVDSLLKHMLPCYVSEWRAGSMSNKVKNSTPFTLLFWKGQN